MRAGLPLGVGVVRVIVLALVLAFGWQGLSARAQTQDSSEIVGSIRSLQAAVTRLESRINQLERLVEDLTRRTGAQGEATLPRTQVSPRNTPTPAPPGQPSAATVYVTRSGTKYHREGCRSLSRSMIPIPLEQARRTYAPCAVCRPPQ